MSSAIALVALTFHVPSFAAMLILLSIACVLTYAALPVFWAMPATILPRRSAAAGIAFVSSVGITSGIISPWEIGQIKEQTGSMDNALYLVAALVLASGLAMWFGLPRSMEVTDR
jgi:nitrate/nitrite transporter NarK